MDLFLLFLIGAFAAVLIVAFSPNFITRPISNVIGRLRGLKAHDPMDWRQTSSSGPWNTDTFCRNCKSWTAHKDIMAGICHSCGSRAGVRSYRSARRIWDGHKWVVQFKYDDSATGYEIVEYS